MTDNPLPDVTERFARTVGIEGDEIVTEMDARAERTGFPTVGPAVGGWLRLLARAVDAERAFEFGSGFGYSAYWLAPAIPSDGQLVLTEIEENRLDRAREYFRRGGYDDRAVFEHGDAVEVVADYDGPFDVVLIDNEKRRYPEAFEAIRETVAVGGVVCADNAMTSENVDFETLVAMLGGDATVDELSEDVHPNTRGVAEYLRRVGADDAFETTLLPLGEGLAVSVRTH
jgi:predicted O-methyltransferase YrrM